MSETSSHRHILRGAAIIGGASIVNVAFGLLRAKASALLLGPTGVGLIGLMQNLLLITGAIAGLGLSYVGARQIAEAATRDDEAQLADARRALSWGAAGLAVSAGGLLWALREPFAAIVLGRPPLADDIGWLALALALTVASVSQSALLTGLRRIGDMARVTILSSLLATFAGVGVLLAFGSRGLMAFVLAAPAATYLFGLLYVAALPKSRGPPASLPRLARSWRELVRLGAPVMVAGLATIVAQFVVRTLVERRLGGAALGHMQAAWSISITYTSFVIQAMGAEYFPRLTAGIQDRATVNRLANEQTEVTLLLAGPVFLVILGAASWVIRLLYSGQFVEAASVLRWQIVGDIFKIAGWPLIFVLLAAGRNRLFLALESAAGVLFVLLTWAGLRPFGIVSTGLAFLSIYFLYLVVIYIIVNRQTGFAWDRAVLFGLVSILTLSCATVYASSLGAATGAIFGGLAALAMGVFALMRLRTLLGTPAPLQAIVRRLLPWRRP